MAPLGYRVSAVARDRLLLVGDAAGYLSPITGQGNEFALRTGRLAATAADTALRAGDLSAGAFAPYVEGRRYEVDRQVDYVRAQLRILRDRDALLRASRDDEYRASIFGPYGIPATEHWLARLYIVPLPAGKRRRGPGSNSPQLYPQGLQFSAIWLKCR